VRAAAWTKRGRRWIYTNYLSTPAAIARWLGGRRSAGPELDLAEAVSVYSSFARQYGAGSAIQRILSGRLQTVSLPRLEEVCAPVTIWWPGCHAGGEPPAASAGLRLDWLEGCGPLAPLDRSEDLVSGFQLELFQPVRVAAG
jgi:hypothetical protein